MDDFVAFEQHGWESVCSEYDEAFTQLTSQSIEPLLNAVGARSGTRLLDIACGPGHASAAAAARGADVLGVDFADNMVARARTAYPHIAFRQADAESLPLADSSFDSVIMSFGLLHLARPERALGEALRVLKPGGRFALTVWAPSDRAVAFAIVLHAIETYGSLSVALPAGPPFFRFSDPAESRRALESAGFADICTREIPQTWSVPNPDALFCIMRDATVRTAGLLRAQTPESLAAIRAAIAESCRAYQYTSGLRIPMPAMLASGARPPLDIVV